jgi:hypothetical protein
LADHFQTAQVTRRFQIARRKDAILFVANVLGIFAYLWLGSWTWTPPQERALQVDTPGDAFVWALSALPVLAMFFVLNIGWGLIVLIRQQWKSGRAWFLVAMIWFIALAIDRAHR